MLESIFCADFWSFPVVPPSHFTQHCVTYFALTLSIYYSLLKNFIKHARQILSKLNFFVCRFLNFPPVPSYHFIPHCVTYFALTLSTYLLFLSKKIFNMPGKYFLKCLRPFLWQICEVSLSAHPTLSAPHHFVCLLLTSKHIFSPLWAENCLGLDNFLLQWVTLQCLCEGDEDDDNEHDAYFVDDDDDNHNDKQLPVAQSIPFIICTISSRTFKNLFSEKKFGLLQKKYSFDLVLTFWLRNKQETTVVLWK